MKRLRRAALIALVPALATAAYVQWTRWSRLAETEHALEEARQRAEQLAPFAGPVEHYERWKRELEQRLSVVRHLEAASDSVRLDDASRLIAESRARVGVESLWMRNGLLELSGRADSAATVNRLGQRLEELELVRDFELRRFEPTGSAGEFTLICRLLEREGERRE